MIKIAHFGIKIIQSGLNQFKYHRLCSDLDELAKAIGVFVQDDSFTIPPELGSVNVKRFDLSLSMQVIVVQCVFREEIVFKPLSKAKDETITLGFRNVILNKSEEGNFINRSPSATGLGQNVK